MTRDELVKRIGEKAIIYGDFTLRSGRKSSYYLDKYLLTTDSLILGALGELIAAQVDESIQRLAGAELGGIPLVSAAGLATGLPTVFVRNQKKTYGTAKQLEGPLEPGDRVLLVEDVCTTGGQILEAAKTLSEAGAVVAQIVGTIDREEGARANIEAAGYRFVSLFCKTDFGL